MHALAATASSAVSIHAPARGATQLTSSRSLLDVRFNPRARAGRDRMQPVTLGVDRVSIHAPARGATSVICSRSATIGVSIHAPRAGRDTQISPSITQSGMFQSTRPRGARRMPTQLFTTLVELFQSTRPRGARPPTCRYAMTSRRMFQSTRPRGARRRLAAEDYDCMQVSIHAPARGATDRSRRYRSMPDGFNPRAPRGARLRCASAATLTHGMFQSTRPRGARRDARSRLTMY